MAVADYVTRTELAEMLDRLKEELKEDNRAQADRVIQAIQRGTSSNF